MADIKCVDLSYPTLAINPRKRVNIGHLDASADHRFSIGVHDS